jgi:hypothetical protein
MMELFKIARKCNMDISTAKMKVLAFRGKSPIRSTIPLEDEESLTSQHVKILET